MTPVGSPVGGHGGGQVCRLIWKATRMTKVSEFPFVLVEDVAATQDAVKG